MTKTTQIVDAVIINNSIEALNEFVNDASLDPLLSALEALKKEPDNASHLLHLTETFNKLGIIQGAVLTYAPYVGLLLTSDIFGDDLE